MASSNDLSFENVLYSSNTETMTLSRVVLTRSQIELYDSASTLFLSIPLTSVSAIEVHQPIFGTNYINIEHNGRGQWEKGALTFKGGGATTFAQAFFRLTEGHLERDQVPESSQTLDARGTANEKKKQK